MKIKKTLLASVTILLMATGNAWADASAQGCLSSGGQANGCSLISAPEIDAATATIPFALLTGIVLLMKERSRSKRSSKSDQ
jgi:hypothetical protein